LDKSILKRLGDCYIAYQLFPFQERYNRFKEKKRYFLEGIVDVESEFHRYVFFHYAMFHRLYPKISKEEIIEYYERRKKGDQPQVKST
jgi:hypothetical protein